MIKLDRAWYELDTGHYTLGLEIDGSEAFVVVSLSADDEVFIESLSASSDELERAAGAWVLANEAECVRACRKARDGFQDGPFRLMARVA